MKKIIVGGSLAFDYIMNFPGVFADNIDPEKLDVMSVSFLAETLKKEKGGTAGNIAYFLALLKTTPAILATAGEDFEYYGRFLEDAGVSLSQVRIVPGESTSLAMILTDRNNNQITAFHPGAMDMADVLSLKDTKAEFCVIAPTKPEAMSRMISECKELKIAYMYDPGMQLPRLSDAQLLEGVEGAEILIANDYEMAVIKKRLMLSDTDLLKKVRLLVTTLGEKGSVVQSNDQKIEISAARPEEVLDPTGAGDAYRAGFLAGYLRDFDLKTCGQLGSLASCYAIEKYGTTNHKFSIEEFKKRYKENFGEEINGEI